jgi:dGTPase
MPPPWYEWSTPTILTGSHEQRLLRDKRMHDKAGDGRDPFRRGARLDLDRLLSTDCWSRLGGITQVLSPDHDVENSFLDPESLVSNRMTHSLRVAQVAREIAVRLISREGHDHEERHELIVSLGGLDADVAYVAGLAHDLGHPPFGHAAEEALDKLAREEFGLVDGFEGNAQSLRIVTKLEAVSSKCGLDLTRATMAAIIKYPWLRGFEGKKWRKFNAYNSELGILHESRRFLPADYPAERQTLEASIMDIADDISYAFQDLEDFHIAGLIPQDAIEALLEDGSEFIRSLKDRLRKNYGDYPFSDGRFDEAVLETQGIIGRVTRHRLRLDDPARVALIKQAGARQIADFIRDVGFQVNHPGEPYYEGGPLISLDVQNWNIIQILKAIATQEIVGTTLVRDGGAQGADYVTFLARDLRRAIESRPQHAVPNRLERMLSDTRHGGPEERLRRIIDYICTLTDKQARKLSWQRGYQRADTR